MTKPLTKSTPEQMQAHLERGHEEGQGLWQILFFTPQDVMAMMMGFAQGDDWARQWLPPLAHLIGRISAIQSATRGQSPQCLCCDTLFWQDELPAVFVGLVPASDEPTQVTMSGICEQCDDGFEDFPALKAGVLDAFRSVLGDDARELPPQVAAIGRA